MPFPKTLAASTIEMTGGTTFSLCGEMGRAKKYFQVVKDCKLKPSRLYAVDDMLDKRLPLEVKLDNVISFRSEASRINAAIHILICEAKLDLRNYVRDQDLHEIISALVDLEGEQPQGAIDFLDFEIADRLLQYGFYGDARKISRAWLQTPSAAANPRFAVHHAVLQAECDLLEGSFKECIARIREIQDNSLLVDLPVSDKVYINSLRLAATQNLQHKDLSVSLYIAFDLRTNLGIAKEIIRVFTSAWFATLMK